MAFTPRSLAMVAACIETIHQASRRVTIPNTLHAAAASSAMSTPDNAALYSTLHQVSNLILHLQNDATKVAGAAPDQLAWRMLFAGITKAKHDADAVADADADADADQVLIAGEVTTTQATYKGRSTTDEATLARYFTMYQLGLVLPTLTAGGALDEVASVDALMGLQRLAMSLNADAENKALGTARTATAMTTALLTTLDVTQRFFTAGSDGALHVDQTAVTGAPATAEYALALLEERGWSKAETTSHMYRMYSELRNAISATKAPGTGASPNSAIA